MMTLLASIVAILATVAVGAAPLLEGSGEIALKD